MTKKFYFKLFAIVLTPLLISCNEANQTASISGEIREEQNPINHKSTVEDSTVVEFEEDEVYYVEFPNEFEILITSNYRDWEHKNKVDLLNENWLDLYQKDGNYQIAKANYTIERSYSDCSGDSTKIIHSKRKTLLLLDNKDLKVGAVKSITPTKKKIWPKETLQLNFEGNSYSFRAEGKVNASYTVSTDDGDELFQEVEDYKLYLSINGGAEVLFLQQASFDQTFMEFRFIGDLDRDGKLDFILSANSNYEEERVLLFLSSDSKEGKGLRQVAEIAVQFDC